MMWSEYLAQNRSFINGGYDISMKHLSKFPQIFNMEWLSVDLYCMLGHSLILLMTTT